MVELQSRLHNIHCDVTAQSKKANDAFIIKIKKVKNQNAPKNGTHVTEEGITAKLIVYYKDWFLPFKPPLLADFHWTLWCSLTSNKVKTFSAR